MNTWGNEAASSKPCFETPYHILKNTFCKTQFCKKITRLGKFNCCSTEIANCSDFLKI